MNTYQNELEAGLSAVRTAARICRSVQAAITSDVLEKRDRSPVTVADFGSQAVICRALQEACPNDPVIGEEESGELFRPENAPFLEQIRTELEQAGVRATPDEIGRWIDRGSASRFSERFWTLDPIDGTKGFLRGQQYAISLALIVEGQIEVALLGCPNLPVVPETDRPAGTIFYAVRGAGSFRVPLDGEAEASRIHVSAAADAAQARFCESVEKKHTSHGVSGQVAERLGITQPPRRLDSQAKYAVVARGEAEIYMRLPSQSGYRQKIWDHAGGVLLVEEAGGTVTDATGKPLEWTHGSELTANRGIIATNGRLHDPLVDALREAGVQ